MGAWIEIIWCLCDMHSFFVAPGMGAWIEIPTLIY